MASCSIRSSAGWSTRWDAELAHQPSIGSARRALAHCRNDAASGRGAWYRPDAVYVAGLSAGGAMALILGQGYPELYAAVGVHSGVPSGVATDLSSALRAMSAEPVDGEVTETSGRPRTSRPVPTIVFHGDADKTVHPSIGTAIHNLSHPRKRRAAGATLLPTDRSTKTRMQARNGRRAVTRTNHSTGGIPDAELWVVHGGGHAWAGGSPVETYTDSGGPDASREMVRFFLQQRLDGTDTHRSP